MAAKRPVSRHDFKNVNNLFAVQNLEMALNKANILQHTIKFFRLTLLRA